MKFVSIILLAVSCVFADGESLIRKYFSTVNEFSIGITHYTETCGDTPLEGRCVDNERSLKEHTLSELNYLLSYNVYGEWKQYFSEADFNSNAYSDFYVYQIQKVTYHDGYYLVLVETDIDIVTFKMVVKGDRISERIIVKRLMKKIKKVD